MQIQKCLALFAFMGMMLGCDRTGGPSIPVVHEIGEKPRLDHQRQSVSETTPVTAREVRRVVRDLGTVLCDGRTIVQVFPITNDSSKPLRLVKVVALTPCCSSVGDHPETVAPWTSVDIPVSLKTGTQSGRKRVEFLIQTDSTECPVWRLELLADLSARQDLIPIEPAVPTFTATSGPGRLVWRVTTRRALDEKPAIPSKISIGEPLTAKFLGPTAEPSLKGQTLEVNRDLEIIVPRSNKVGRNHTEIEVLCDDGTSAKTVLSWVVAAQIEASPPGLVLFADEGIVQKSFLLKSKRGPFRIAEITSGLLEQPYSPTGESLGSHPLSFRLDPSRVKPGSKGSIRVRVDDPDQPEVVISLFVLERRKGEDR